jgi:hypothetical protein
MDCLTEIAAAQPMIDGDKGCGTVSW